MMWVLLTVFFLATPALGSYHDVSPQYLENRQVENTFNVRRPTIYMECPLRAICGVVFDFNRTRNGVKVPERRIIRHCQCPDSTPCPIDAEHRVFSSIRKREYLCNPVATLNPCPRTDRIPAKELVEGYEEYDYFSYFRINCLCPRHTNPRMPAPHDMALATVMRRVRFDWGRHMSYHERHCIRN